MKRGAFVMERDPSPGRLKGEKIEWRSCRHFCPVHLRPCSFRLPPAYCRGFLWDGPEQKGNPDNMAANAPLLQLSGLTKAYPGVVANDDVSFNIGPGQIHALLGENGAGKSTLVKMVYGLVKPDAGEMRLRGQAFAPAQPSDARQNGIAMVFQHFSLFDALDVAENVALGMENPPPLRDLAKRIRDVSEAYGLPLDPARLVGELSAGERQRVEIIRCLLQDPKLLIMDEPTSVLTPQEVDILFRTLRKLANEGTAILYISHKLDEIRTLCSEATILRGGKKVATCDPREKSARDLAELMVGQLLTPPERPARPFGNVVLQVDGLSLASNNPFGTSLKDINFALRAGEVLGIAGVAGNGQDELLAGAIWRIGQPFRPRALAGQACRAAWPERAARTGACRCTRGTAGPCRRPGYVADRKRLSVGRASQRVGKERLHRLGQDARFSQNP